MSNAVSFIMSEADILKEYREAKFPREQIKILAEQNLVPSKVMRDFIVSRLGNAPKLRSKRPKEQHFKWTEENAEKVRSLAAQKMTDGEIGDFLHVSRSSVSAIRYAYGIPIGKYERKKKV